MYLLNAWLLDKSEINIVLLEEFFPSRNHIFLFYGSYSILGLCPNNNILRFYFHQFLFVSLYLMTYDKLLVSILKKKSIETYSQNFIILQSLH